MAKTKDKLIFTGGIIFHVKDGKRVAVNSFEEAMQIASKCCGIDCCKGVIRLKDQATGNTVELSVNNGQVIVDDTSTVAPETVEKQTAVFNISQSGTNDPVLTILENSIQDTSGGTTTFSVVRNAIGDYSITTTGTNFTNSNTSVVPNSNSADTDLSVTVVSATSVLLEATDGAGANKDDFTGTVTFTYYPNA